MRIPACLIACALLLTACGGSDTGENAPDEPVRIGFGLEPSGLDPTTTSGAALEQVALDNVYENLVTRTEKGEIIPQLATDWSISDDGLTYTFTLAQDVTFHDGSAFDADDVVASLEASSADDSANPDAKLMTGVQSVTKVDDSTVELTIDEPNINMLDALATNAGVIIPSDNQVDLSAQSNGTGPYTIAEWNTGSSITLKRNENYWGEAPQVDEVIFQYYADATAAANAMASGDLDILTFTTAETLKRFEGNDDYQVTRAPETAWMTLAFNHDNESLKDIDVRRAIRMAIDKDGLITVLGGIGTRVGSMTSPADPWFDELLAKIDAYNPDEARALLEGKNVSLSLRVADVYDKAMVEYVAAQLGEVGIDVTIEQMDFASWLDDVYTKRNYDMTIVQHVDPWTLTYYGNPDYYWNYDNPEAAALAEKALTSRTEEDRNAGLAELARFVSEDAASDWLYSPDTIMVATKDVTGYPSTRMNSQFHLRGLSRQ